MCQRKNEKPRLAAGLFRFLFARSAVLLVLLATLLLLAGLLLSAALLLATLLLAASAADHLAADHLAAAPGFWFGF